MSTAGAPHASRKNNSAQSQPGCSDGSHLSPSSKPHAARCRTPAIGVQAPGSCSSSPCRLDTRPTAEPCT
eukprot:6871391-Alexandrium_andersonii.AAC.1